MVQPNKVHYNSFQVDSLSDLMFNYSYLQTTYGKYFIAQLSKINTNTEKGEI